MVEMIFPLKRRWTQHACKCGGMQPLATLPLRYRTDKTHSWSYGGVTGSGAGVGSVGAGGVTGAGIGSTGAGGVTGAGVGSTGAGGATGAGIGSAGAGGLTGAGSVGLAGLVGLVGLVGLAGRFFSAWTGALLGAFVSVFCLFWWPMRIAKVRLRIKNMDPR